ncbi:hypothetical protein TanjilG_04696 [Lupinus angustifolius]|uniref:Rhamnogalacturonase A/B/Epimerase-like pectate lyase domain-containing protein n=1 Tax=Lupinus angustifolius TaxID=3871 RepID=A0A4P1RJR1_LUPAN|nr:hypothetical protein TanjilG_04696 [Lupinus angustifolius]
MSHTMKLCPKLRNAYVCVISIIVILVSVAECSGVQYQAISCRKHSAVLTDFGAVGDGKTSNTKVFNNAIKNLSKYANDGGAILIVPPGKWLTGSFNLTSHFTLFLQKGAVILASQHESEWPSLPVLPSYGRGRDAPGGRFSSLIFGTNLTDVVITDSCTNTKIEDCYIVSGDDCIAVKSGWDQYGIKVGIPTQYLIIRRLTCISPDSAMIALGSEMSGGIKHIRAEDNIAINTQSAIRIKTAVGRGGYVKDIFVKGMTLKTIKYVFWMTGAYGSHADSGFNPKALPKITRINYRDITADNVTYSARLDGITNDPFTGICLSNVHIKVSEENKKLQWNCTNIAGVTSNVTPQPCSLLPQKEGQDCPYPEDKLPIDNVQLKTCSFK